MQQTPALARLIIVDTVSKQAQTCEPEQGAIYRDLDGQLVYLVKVRRNLCIWAPIGDKEKALQVTHRDNFIRRFKPLSPSRRPMAA